MLASQKKTDKRLKNEEIPTSTRKLQEDKLKKSSSNISTSRSFVQKKSSAADVYAQKKNIVQSARGTKKVANSNVPNVAPMKDYLKSSPSSISQTTYDRTPKFKKELKAQTLDSARGTSKSTPKNVPFSNVTVNSPITKKKLNLNREPEKVFKKIDSSQGLYMPDSY